MPFEVLDLNTAPSGSVNALERIIQGYGFLPNLAGVIAESPATLNGLLAAMSAFEGPDMTLSPIERQVVLLAVSVKNRCEYCTAAHSMLADTIGLDEREVENLQHERLLSDDRLEALRRFAEAVLESRGWISDRETEKFVNAGFTNAQILEVIFGVALKTLTNYANHIAKPPVNDQFARFLPNWTSTDTSLEMRDSDSKSEGRGGGQGLGAGITSTT